MGVVDRYGRAMVAPQSLSLNDPAFLEYVRTGDGSTSVKNALKVSAVWRCVELISGTMGMLPLPVRETQADGEIVNATTHPMYRILMHKPNQWQNAYQFKQQMQYWVLVHGNAYAVISRRAGRVVALNPVDPSRVRVEQDVDFSLRYEVSRDDEAYREFRAEDILHIRGLSDDGYDGLSRVQQAADMLSINEKSQRAVERMHAQGLHLGGNLSHPGKLSTEAYDRLRTGMDARHAGPENAGKWIITEEGMTATPFGATAVDGQLVETRAANIEDLGRLFGVPRPLLGVDDTSWGSGIESLAALFVRFGLNPWFKCWEDELKIKCFEPSEWDNIGPDFAERELLRGTIKEQFEAYAKASGSGGHRPFMEANEIREDLGLGAREDGKGLVPAGQTAVAPDPQIEAMQKGAEAILASLELLSKQNACCSSATTK